MSLLFSESNLEVFDEEPATSFFLQALTKLSTKWPKEFEADLLKNYQRYIALTEQEFRSYRSSRHQLRILCYHYLMRKALLRRKPMFSKELDAQLRILPTHLSFPFGKKSVLGIAIAIQLSSVYERFEDVHILSAVQKILPDIQTVKESFLFFQKPHDLLRLLYLEIEKNNSCTFSHAEITVLKQRLPHELTRHVEKLAPSLFGYYNLEETIKTICFLNQELRTPSDLPQITISFEHALDHALIFRILVVRVLHMTSATLIDSFQRIKDLSLTTQPFEYMPERCALMDDFSLGVKKEASVFRLQIPKQPFLLRSDASINLYRARNHVLSILIQAIGEVRDYNGGLFSKQFELFAEFKHQFEQTNPELLEDFFYALNPPEMRAMISLETLIQLFNLFLKAHAEELPKQENIVLKILREKDAVFAVLRFCDPAFQERIQKSIDSSLFSNDLSLWFNIKNPESLTLGYLYKTQVAEQQERFIQVLQKNITSWFDEIQNTQTLHLCSQHLPVSLDPRFGGDEISTVVLKLLFEGLMCFGKDGKLQCAIADSVAVTQNGKCYTFKLKNCNWSNGDKITAHDFCYTWKKTLSPYFKSAFTHLLYIILNAKKAKEGLISVEKVGIEALDDEILSVQLENPCSYFLELVAHPLYFPVNHRIDRLHPNWSLQSGPAYVCNGPFHLERTDRDENYALRKNPHYWNRHGISLESIHISRANGREAIKMFQNKETDWLGRPLRAWEPLFSKNISAPIEKIPFNTSYWYVFNVRQFPFQSRKMRQAFAYAIDRQAIIDQLSLQNTPALTPLPLGHTQFSKIYSRKNLLDARRLFKEALQELQFESLPPLTLIHPDNDLRKKIAELVTEQWKDVLGVVVQRESFSFKHLFTKIIHGDYQIGAMSWWPKIDTPLYTLDAFRSSEEQINFPKWENTIYKSLLEKAQCEISYKKQRYLFAKAEALLIREMPVIPLFHEVELFMKQKYIEGIVPSSTGNIEFRYARINKGAL